MTDPKITNQRAKELVQKAIQARQFAYTPYSHYPVGAALLTKKDTVYTGANVENAAYPTTMCAERIAVFKAVTSGEQEFQAIAVVTQDGGTPCGSCRQVLAEFGTETIVIIADTSGKIHITDSVENLLPNSFGPSNLLEQK